ncbi:hypothetical protein HOS78_gp088 [Lactobacillus phage Bacchae]|uniref:Uncharacterized protein n=1 Tax=Lactobacillus phage Bacchae TaxID=2079429 RepID=A0A2K9VCZ2_9CAUD|nr:hypothetical protein HOS78_gp088 [Lactobacillus phage Bacchae]AUV60024.1 hypothetical protein [Lactobacillus phage Bacchae]
MWRINKMKIDYDNAKHDNDKYNTAKQDWKVGDIIQDDLIGGGLFMVAEVPIDDYVLYTLINLEEGRSLVCTNTVSELQQTYQEKGDRVLNGTFKYADDNK